MDVLRAKDRKISVCMWDVGGGFYCIGRSNVESWLSSGLETARHVCVCVWWKAMLLQQHAARQEMFCCVWFIIKSCHIHANISGTSRT